MVGGYSIYTCTVYSMIYSIGSMHDILAHIWRIFMVDVRKYTIHGSYGIRDTLIIYYIYVHIIN